MMWDSDLELEGKVVVDVMCEHSMMVVVENDELAIVWGPIHVKLRASAVGLTKNILPMSVGQLGIDLG